MQKYHKSNKKAVIAYRKREKEKGKKLVQFNITEEEKLKMKEFLINLRSK